MKKMLIVVSGLLLVSVLAFAEGGKNRVRHDGDIGEGSVVQTRVRVQPRI